MTELIRDVRIAIRTLLAARGFTGAAVLTLGLGLALSAAALIVVNAYLLSSLPYPGASRLYWVRYSEPGVPPPQNLADLDWSSLDHLIEHPIAWDLDMFYLVGGSYPESAPGAWVTPGFMDGFGVRPALGRGFDASAFVPGSPQVALVSHRLWQTRFGGDAQIVGRQFEAYVSDRPDEAETFTIVGVLPADLWHVNIYTDVLTPLRTRTFPYMVRIREDHTAAEVATAVASLVRSGAQTLPEGWQPAITSAHEQYVLRMRPILRAATGAAAVVMLIAWANVAGLLLIRATRRQQEVAVRIALGAGGLAIVRLFLIEALVLGTAATAVGLLAGGAMMRWISPLIQRELGRPAPAALQIDGTVLAGSMAAGLLAALVCALAPLAALWRLGLLGALHSGSRTATEGRGSQRARSALIALQVAGSVALLTAGSLMARSVVELVRVDFGISPRDVLSASLTLRQRTYPDDATRIALYERLLPRLSSVPGVESVALASGWPLQEPAAARLQVEYSGARAISNAGGVPVTADYFATLRIPVTAGRTFTPLDRGESEPVAVISQALARRISPDGQALGARLTVLPDRDAESSGQRLTPRRVVGIVGDARQSPGDVYGTRMFADVRGSECLRDADVRGCSRIRMFTGRGCSRIFADQTVYGSPVNHLIR